MAEEMINYEHSKVFPIKQMGSDMVSVYAVDRRFGNVAEYPLRDILPFIL